VEELLRTNIVIDERLMRKALQASGLRTKRAAVEAALRLLVQVHGQAGVNALKGKIHWQDPEDTAASPSRRRAQT
jgi:Arc/MetJ family transcription regulator